MVFANKPLNEPRINAAIRRKPFLYFGLPFISAMLLGTYFLSSVAQVRYDLHDSRVRQLSKAEQLRLQKDRKPLDIREEYFRLSSGGALDKADDWENKRVPRLPGQAEWGELPPTKPSSPSSPSS